MLEPPRKILVIMLRRIGDVLLTTPALRALKAAFPEAELHFLSEPPGAEAVEGDPNIDRLLAYEAAPGESPAAAYWRWLRTVRAEGYDWVVDYMGNPRSAILAFASGARLRAGPAHVWHRWAYNRPLVQSPETCYAGLEKIRVLRQLGIEADESDPLPRLAVPREAALEAERTTARLWEKPEGPLVGLVPASRKETRRWPASRYGELGRRLAEEAGARLLVFWGPGERPLAEETARLAGPAARVAPETPRLKGLAALLARCSLVVTNCNGPKHLAVAVGVPTITVHGSSDPACWNPPSPGSGPPSPGPGSARPRHVVVRREELPCIGCRQNECPIRTLECLTELPAERVAQEALALLSPAGKA